MVCGVICTNIKCAEYLYRYLCNGRGDGGGEREYERGRKISGYPIYLTPSLCLHTFPSATRWFWFTREKGRWGEISKGNMKSIFCNWKVSFHPRNSFLNYVMNTNIIYSNKHGRLKYSFLEMLRIIWKNPRQVDWYICCVNFHLCRYVLYCNECKI